MALAVAGALAAPAAALAQVQIGGSLTVFYYQHDPDNKSVGQTGDILESSEPEMYIRSEEKLGGGNSVWFTCTSSLDGFISGTGSAFGICGRNSALGFRGGWGNAYLGNWDTPEKMVFNRARGWFGGTNAFTGGSAVVLQNGTSSGGTNPAGTGTAGSAAFFRRQAQTLNYNSPDWGGFSFNAAYSAANETTAIPDASSLSPRMYSLAGQFARGGLYVGAAVESHSDYNPANQTIGTAAGQYDGGTDTNYIVVAGYQFSGFNVRGMYSNIKYEVAGGQDLKVDGFGLFADWNISGPHTLRAQYVIANDPSGSSTVNVGSYKSPVAVTSNAGAQLMAIFYSYAVSKRTEVSFGYSQIASDDNANFSKGKTAASLGSTQTTTGFVFKHSF
jgi:hypothetical protein